VFVYLNFLFFLFASIWCPAIFCMEMEIQHTEDTLISGVTVSSTVLELVFQKLSIQDLSLSRQVNSTFRGCADNQFFSVFKDKPEVFQQFIIKNLDQGPWQNEDECKKSLLYCVAQRALFCEESVLFDHVLTLFEDNERKKAREQLFCMMYCLLDRCIQESQKKKDEENYFKVPLSQAKSICLLFLNCGMKFRGQEKREKVYKKLTKKVMKKFDDLGIEVQKNILTFLDKITLTKFDENLITDVFLRTLDRFDGTYKHQWHRFLSGHDADASGIRYLFVNYIEKNIYKRYVDSKNVDEKNEAIKKCVQFYGILLDCEYKKTSKLFSKFFYSLNSGYFGAAQVRYMQHNILFASYDQRSETATIIEKTLDLYLQECINNRIGTYNEYYQLPLHDDFIGVCLRNRSLFDLFLKRYDILSPENKRAMNKACVYEKLRQLIQSNEAIRHLFFSGMKTEQDLFEYVRFMCTKGNETAYKNITADVHFFLECFPQYINDDFFENLYKFLLPLFVQDNFAAKLVLESIHKLMQNYFLGKNIDTVCAKKLVTLYTKWLVYSPEHSESFVQFLGKYILTPLDDDLVVHSIQYVKDEEIKDFAIFGSDTLLCVLRHLSICYVDGNGKFLARDLVFIANSIVDLLSLDYYLIVLEYLEKLGFDRNRCKLDFLATCIEKHLELLKKTDDAVDEDYQKMLAIEKLGCNDEITQRLFEEYISFDYKEPKRTLGKISNELHQKLYLLSYLCGDTVPIEYNVAEVRKRLEVLKVLNNAVIKRLQKPDARRLFVSLLHTMPLRSLYLVCRTIRAADLYPTELVRQDSFGTWCKVFIVDTIQRNLFTQCASVVGFSLSIYLVLALRYNVLPFPKFNKGFFEKWLPSGINFAALMKKIRS